MRYWSPIAVLIAVVVVLFIGGCGYAFYASQVATGEVDLTVEGKERIAEDNSGKWVVFATDGTTYQVTDNILFGLTESTDRYHDLEVDKSYHCKYIGDRWHFPITLYKNLYDCEQVG